MEIQLQDPLAGGDDVCPCVRAHTFLIKGSSEQLEQNTDCGLLKEFLISCDTGFLAPLFAQE